MAPVKKGGKKKKMLDKAQGYIAFGNRLRFAVLGRWGVGGEDTSHSQMMTRLKCGMKVNTVNPSQNSETRVAGWTMQPGCADWLRAAWPFWLRRLAQSCPAGPPSTLPLRNMPSHDELSLESQRRP